MNAPNREPTHKALDHRKLMNLGLVVEEAADGEPVTCSALDELALENGVDASHLYAAIAITTEIEIAREHDVAFVACAGNCQHWGALECIEHLATMRQQRMDAGQPGFDIQARTCLDQCEHAPVLQVQTTSGTALLQRATPETLTDAIAHAIE